MILRSLLFIIGAILVVGWLIGVFMFKASHLIHILIVLAAVSVLAGLMRKNGIS